MPDQPSQPPARPPGATAQMASLSAELAALSADHRRFLTARHPLTAAIWLALQKNADDVIRTQADLVQLRQEAAAPSDEPGERDPSASQAARPAILVLGEALVAQALLGNSQAINQIAERIEGKVGTRRGEEDPGTAQRRADLQAVMEGIVGGLTRAAAERPGDDARVIDAEVSS